MGLVHKKFKFSWFLGIILILMITILLSFSTPFSFTWAGKETKRSKCRSQLHSLGIGLLGYRLENDSNGLGGTNPWSLVALTTELTNANYFICPASDDKAGDLSNVDTWSSYTYIPNAGSNADAVLLYCPPKNHGNEIGLVLTVGGSVKGIEKDQFWQAVEQGKSALNSGTDKQ